MTTGRRYHLARRGPLWTVQDTADPDRTQPATGQAIPDRGLTRPDALDLLNQLEKTHAQARSRPAVAS